MNTASFDLTADQSINTLCSSVIDGVKSSLSSVLCSNQATGEDFKGDIQVLQNLFEARNLDALLYFADRASDQAKDSIAYHNILGEAHAELGNNLLAVSHFGKVLRKEPTHLEAAYKSSIKPYVYNNIALSYRKLGFQSLAEGHIKSAIKIKPDFAGAYNNLGCIFNDQAKIGEARSCFLQSIELAPTNYNAYWNLHSLSQNMDMAECLLRLCLENNPTFQTGIITLAGMKAMSGNISVFEKLKNSELSVNPIVDTFCWLLEQDPLPKIEFNRWAMFDAAIALSKPGRACYEYGVWMGSSLEYLMRSFDKGFGFDTFNGLPEDWRSITKGSYSSFKQIPDIPNVEFVIGEFKNSLPDFFSMTRPMAGIINFDADLYSSTLTALEQSSSVIDEKTILIFDEMIVNEDWRQDEYRALTEFCMAKGYKYEVLLASIFTKQVVCRLKRP